jgi:hypothetical protein
LNCRTKGISRRGDVLDGWIFAHIGNRVGQAPKSENVGMAMPGSRLEQTGVIL